MSQRRVLLDGHRDEAERILAVAGTAGHDLLAIDEGRAQVGVTLAVRARCIVDGAAGVDLGRARRTERAAGLRRGHAAVALDRKVAAVTGADAERDRSAVATARDCRARCSLGRTRAERIEHGEGVGVGGRAVVPALAASEERVEKVLCGGAGSRGEERGSADRERNDRLRSGR